MAIDPCIWLISDQMDCEVRSNSKKEKIATI